MKEVSNDLGRTVFAVLFMGALIATTLWILRPFIAPLLWAVMIAVATWPLLLRMQGWLFGRRWLAVAAMSITLLLVLVLPVTLAVGVLVTNAATLVSWAGAISTVQVPPPPTWLSDWPLVGEHAHGMWQQFSLLSNKELLERAAPYAESLLAWLLPQIGNIGFVLVQFLLTVVITAIVYHRGELIAGFVLRFARRLAGAQAESAVRLAAQAIRGVALGVVGTALIQSALAGVGLAVAKVPFTGLLTAVAFVMTVAQLGVIFVMVPAVIWMYATGSMVGATGLLIWTIIVSTTDNFIRPLLIQRGADLSLLLIFAGVIGGLLTLGVIGIFVGPVVLAVSWTLLKAWVDSSSVIGKTT